MGFPACLALLFIGLKLGDVIDWSWLWVLSPIWIPLVIVAVFCTFCFTIAGLVAIGEAVKKSK